MASVGMVREIVPSMFDRCLHVPALITAKANRTPVGSIYTGVQLTGGGQRRVLLKQGEGSSREPDWYDVSFCIGKGRQVGPSQAQLGYYTQGQS